MRVKRSRFNSPRKSYLFIDEEPCGYYERKRLYLQDEEHSASELRDKVILEINAYDAN